ncbi:MAG: M48 family metalloprotease [Candidatus Helarchaeota archaeon]|nr:M48 family metalloprotease [Candidatus Helarchaeota archaeon]
MTLAVMLLFSIIFGFMLLIGYLIGLEGIYIIIYPMGMAFGFVLLQWLLSDLRTMMIISTLPLTLYLIAYSFMWGSYGSRDRSAVVLIGLLAWVFYFLMNLGVLLVSRYREYYADNYSKEVMGAAPLTRGLIKIAYINESGTVKTELSSAEATLGAFFIIDSKIVEDIELLSEISQLGSLTTEERKAIEKKIKKEKRIGG